MALCAADTSPSKHRQALDKKVVGTSYYKHRFPVATCVVWGGADYWRGRGGCCLVKWSDKTQLAN